MKKKLIVLHVDHKHGCNMLQFDSEEKLNAWKHKEAQEHWEDIMDIPMPLAGPEEIVDLYYEAISSASHGAGEYWTTGEFEVEFPEIDEVIEAAGQAVAFFHQVGYCSSGNTPPANLERAVNKLKGE